MHEVLHLFLLAGCIILTYPFFLFFRKVIGNPIKSYAKAIVCARKAGALHSRVKIEICMPSIEGYGRRGSGDEGRVRDRVTFVQV